MKTSFVRILLTGLTTLLLFTSSSPPLRGAPVAVPIIAPGEAAERLDGNSVFRPFDPESPGRFQQVYSSSLFDSVPNGGSIVALSFRVDAFIGHSFAANIERIQLKLSTTARNPDGLSPVFDENVGSDDYTFIGPTTFGVSGSEGGGFIVNFYNPGRAFSYDPAKGNLLLDFRIYEGIGPLATLPGAAILDAFDVVGDSVSSVYGNGVTMPTSGQVSSLGLATAIRIIPVPEPSTVALLSLGGLLAFVLGWNRSRKG